MQRRTVTKSICQQVTKQIMEEIERGTKPWEPPWLGGDDWPRNAKTRRRYIGEFNVLILDSARANLGFSTSRWLTAHQVEALGGWVKPGEKGTTILFGRRPNRRDQRGRLVGGFSHLYSVFNVEQCTGLHSDPPLPNKSVCSFPRLESLIAACGAEVRVGGTRAFYTGEGDYVQIPPCRLFWDGSNFAHVLCHELAHWARRPERLNGQRFKDSRLNPFSYLYIQHAYEEVVAELTAAFLCRSMKINPTTSAAAYIAEWLEVLKADSSLVPKAAREAVQVCDYLQAFERARHGGS